MKEVAGPCLQASRQNPNPFWVWLCIVYVGCCWGCAEIELDGTGSGSELVADKGSIASRGEPMQLTTSANRQQRIAAAKAPSCQSGALPGRAAALIFCASHSVI